MTEQRPKSNGEVQVPVWVAIVTYFMCWGGGAFLLAFREPTKATLITGALLIVFPLVGFRPLELIRDIRWGRQK